MTCHEFVKLKINTEAATRRFSVKKLFAILKLKSLKKTWERVRILAKM